MTRKLRLTLVISSLGAGGAEKVLCMLANQWADINWTVRLLTFDHPDRPLYYSLDPRIELCQLDLLLPSSGMVSAVANNLWRLWQLRKAIAKGSPDVVLSFMDTCNILTLAATRGLGVPVVVSERIHPAHQPLATGWSILRKILYRRAHTVVAQTKRALDWHSRAIREKGRVIANPVSAIPVGQSTFRVIAVGRLVPQKEFDLLLRAFAEVAPRHPAWSLVLWGEGPERPALEQLVETLRLSTKATLPGLSPRAGGWIDGGGVFVLSSRFEGFPNVLLEAMAAGLPVIATDCLAGPAELIRDGENGLLVPAGEVAPLAAALDRLLKDAPLREQLSEGARESTRAYSPDRILTQWTAVLTDAVG